MIALSRWKILLVIFAAVIGVLFSLPNILPKDVRDGLPGFIPKNTLNLGLDLQGGSFLLFEVDTAAVPLSQLESLGQGYVIELAAPLASAPVRLVACGRVIGLAELVAVGDRLGARITHLAPRDAERTRH